MAYEGTEVSVAKSQEAIRRLIYAHKGSSLALISDPPREGFEALITIAEVSYRIRVMARCKDVSRDRVGSLRAAGVQQRAREQEERRVWRVLFHHLKALFEAADSGVIDIRDVIMPYVVLRDNRTLSSHLVPQLQELMTMNPTKLLTGE